MKICVNCGQPKDEAEFFRSRANADGRQAYCKECSMRKQREYHRADPARNRAYKRRQYLKNPAVPILAQIKRRAAQNGLSCDLTIEDVKRLLAETKTCPVLGVSLVHRSTGVRQGPADNSPSIDRFDPKLGYVLGNVGVISQRANRLKDDASIEEMERVLEYMRRVQRVSRSATDCGAEICS